jgi:hypothetical protein
MTIDKQQPDKELEINVFARFFGAILMDLRYHNLRFARQNEAPLSYVQESNVEFIKHVR